MERVVASVPHAHPFLASTGSGRAGLVLVGDNIRRFSRPYAGAILCAAFVMIAATACGCDT